MLILKKQRLPRALGECADVLYELRSRRIRAEGEVARLRAMERPLRERLAEKLAEGGARGIAGKVATARIATKDFWSARDWGKVLRFVRRHRASDLLYKRISSTAVAKYMAAGRVVPGLEHVVVRDVTLTKVAR